MLRLFLKLYLLLMLPAAAAFLLLMFVTDEVMTRLNSEQQRARAASAFERAERIINDSRVPDWRGRLKLVETTFNIEHNILPLSEALDDWFWPLAIPAIAAAAGDERLRALALAVGSMEEAPAALPAWTA